MPPKAPPEDRIASSFNRLHRIMARLRGPDGCPWDRQQDLSSLRTYLVEETFELLEAMDQGGIEDHREELGDLLFQIVFQARIREEQGAFDLAEVADTIAAKLERRHPHVFGDTKVTSAAEVRHNWEQIKLTEKQRTSVLDGVPRQLPGLRRATRLGQKAAAVGFDWPDISGVRAKVEEELAELDAAIHERLVQEETGEADGGDLRSRQGSAVEAEFGDLLFALCQYGRHLGVSPEDALLGCNRRFINRFNRIEAEVALSGDRIEELGIDELERLWQRAKRATC